jgi:putative DNA primase/helicase
VAVTACSSCGAEASTIPWADGWWLCSDCVDREEAGRDGAGAEQLLIATESEMRELRSRPTPRRAARVVAKLAADVEPDVVRWLWRGWLPLGMLSLLAGLPGLGKSTLGLKLAADVTRGALDGALQGEPADVLIVSYEDALAETIVPRLMAANADLSRVHLVGCDRVDQSVDLTVHVAEIDGLAERHRARLLFVDPLVAGLPAGEVSSHRDQDVRSVLAPLALMAERRDLCALASMHFSKAAVDALLGVGGSIGFVGAARSVLIFGADPNDERGEEGPARVLAHRKCNVGRRRKSLACWVQPREIDLAADRTAETSRLIVGGEIDVQADELVHVREKKVSPIAQAERFLRHLLSDGPHRATECQELAEDEDISIRTLRRAKDNLCVDSYREGSEWWWRLPDEDENDGERFE